MTRLLDPLADPAVNRLPGDGIVNYYGPVVTDPQAYFGALLEGIPWQHDEVVVFGRRIVTAREIAWYADADYPYTYSQTTKQALAWNDELRALKLLVERLSGATYNSCLANLYHHGDEGMGWHSDDEECLGHEMPIASLSFGAERTFRFRHKRTGETVSLVLENGSLLVMKGATQTNWKHALPKTKKVTAPRINLTFRTMIEPRQQA
jgi:alkylated DNA repair dioxygenase AlkB